MKQKQQQLNDFKIRRMHTIVSNGSSTTSVSIHMAISHLNQQLLLAISKSGNSKPPRSVMKQTIFKGKLGIIGVTMVNDIFTRIATETVSTLKYQFGHSLMYCSSTSP